MPIGGANRVICGFMLLCVGAACVRAEGRLSYGPQGGSEVQVVEIGQAAVRMSQSGSPSWLLYRDVEQAVYIIDDAQRRFQRVDKAMAEEMMAQIRAMQAAVERQLAALPPDQRKMMRGMMPALPDYSAGNYRVERLEGQREAAGYACQPLRVYRDEAAVEEMCLASIASLRLEAKDMALLKRMGTTLGQVAANFGADAMAAVLEKVEGVPVEHRDPGAAQAKLQLLEVRRGPQPAQRFEVPPGYQPQALSGGIRP